MLHSREVRLQRLRTPSIESSTLGALGWTKGCLFAFRSADALEED